MQPGIAYDAGFGYREDKAKSAGSYAFFKKCIRFNGHKKIRLSTKDEFSVPFFHILIAKGGGLIKKLTKYPLGNKITPGW